MEHDRNTAYRRDKRFGLRTIAVHEFDVQSRKPLEPMRVPHETSDGIALPEQQFNEVTPDKARTAGDQNSFLE
jgi:hypothetical protein